MIWLVPEESYKVYEKMHSLKEVTGENWETANKFLGVVNENIWSVKLLRAPIFVVHIIIVDYWKFIWNENVWALLAIEIPEI